MSTTDVSVSSVTQGTSPSNTIDGHGGGDDDGDDDNSDSGKGSDH